MNLGDLNKPEGKVVELVNNKDGCHERYDDGRIVKITKDQWRKRLSQLLGVSRGQSQSTE